MSGTPVLDAVRDLAPLIAKRSEEIEKAGTMPADLLSNCTSAALEGGRIKGSLSSWRGGGGRQRLALPQHPHA